MSKKPLSAARRFNGELRTDRAAQLLYDKRIEHDITVANVIEVGLYALETGELRFLHVAKGITPVIEVEDE